MMVFSYNIFRLILSTLILTDMDRTIEKYRQQYRAVSTTVLKNIDSSIERCQNKRHFAFEVCKAVMDGKELWRQNSEKFFKQTPDDRQGKHLWKTFKGVLTGQSIVRFALLWIPRFLTIINFFFIQGREVLSQSFLSVYFTLNTKVSRNFRMLSMWMGK